MKKIFLLLLVVNLTSCGAKFDNNKSNLIEQNLKLKVGPLWYDNETEIDFVYGVNTNETEKDFITEFHFNFGGKPSCSEKQIITSFDFGSNKELILSDSINKLLPSTEEIIKRISYKSKVDFVFQNPNPGTLIFSIEKINLKPNGKKNQVFLNLNSSCYKNFKLPINLIKFNVLNIEALYEKYIISELSKQNENELLNKKVVFSFNNTFEEGKYLIDYVDQNYMFILTYDKTSKEYLIHNTEKKLIKKIKRST